MRQLSGRALLYLATQLARAAVKLLHTYLPWGGYATRPFQIFLPTLVKKRISNCIPAPRYISLHLLPVISPPRHCLYLDISSSRGCL
ncbi:hypothetical protein B0T24DRAFT_173667 [Lasiosphaeria ovina]|uniref:Secreted protein n=1 Tax=Lasiosphaeria ovina TaxID=92902 RepID=A0AAE0NE85_9PEZI|nr:hypothetical protein B0T24DRAFT_173667 [Lasiosphaeria ovina]